MAFCKYRLLKSTAVHAMLSGSTSTDNKGLPDKRQTSHSAYMKATCPLRNASCEKKDSEAHACRRGSHTEASLDVFRKAWVLVCNEGVKCVVNWRGPNLLKDYFWSCEVIRLLIFIRLRKQS